jgi:hypothetical protein
MHDDDDKKSILARRARFIAAALATLTGGMASCDGCSDVEIVDDDGGAGAAEPQPCLTPPRGTGGEGGTGGTPQPCLSQPLGGGGEGGSGGKSGPCLTAPANGGGGAGGAFPCLAPK